MGGPIALFIIPLIEGVKAVLIAVGCLAALTIWILIVVWVAQAAAQTNRKADQ